MPHILEKSSKTTLFTFEQEMFAVSKGKTKVQFSYHPDGRVLFSIIRGQDGYYLFKDTFQSLETEVRVNGKTVYCFAFLPKEDSDISVHEKDQSKEYCIHFERHPRKKASVKRCNYCWGNFNQDEKAVIVDEGPNSGEYHETCFENELSKTV